MNTILIFTVNLIGRPASQSTTFKNYHASIAVDDVKCKTQFSHTAENDEPSWWLVDLETDYKIVMVRILTK